jgi:oligosaccharide repeat unit polymerase
VLKNILAPGRLMLLVWTLSVLSYCVFFNELPTPQVLGWVAGLVLLFFLSSNIDAGQVTLQAFRVGRVVVVRNACLVLVPFQLFYLYQCVLIVVSSGGLANYLPAVRAAALSGTPLIPGYEFYLQINTTMVLLSLFGLAFISLTNEETEYKKQFYIVYVISLAASIIDASRSAFIVGLLALIALNLAAGKLSAKRMLFSTVVVFTGFTVTFSLFRAVIDTDALSTVRWVFVYVCGSLKSMDPVLSGRMPVYWFEILSISNKLSAIGLPLPTYNLLDLKWDYVDLPYGFSTNVFSAFGLYYYNMGFVGSILFMAAIGWISGRIFRSRLNSPFLLTAYALIWPAIVLTPFHDYFVQQGYALLKLAIYIFLLRVIHSFRWVNIRSFATSALSDRM